MSATVRWRYRDALTPMIGGSLSILTLGTGIVLGLATRCPGVAPSPERVA